MSEPKRISIYTLIAAGLVAIAMFLTTVPADARSKGRASCGAGCQQAMGSCRVDNELWDSVLNAKSSGVRVTSCCRSPEYNRRLASCGYKPSRSSHHMSGNAVDLIVSPARCNARSLSAYGFKNVCPHYHYGHCHIAKCGTPRGYDEYRARVKYRAQQIRIEERNRVSTLPPALPANRYARPKTIEFNGLVFEDNNTQTEDRSASPSWWFSQDSGATR